MKRSFFCVWCVFFFLFSLVRFVSHLQTKLCAQHSPNGNKCQQPCSFHQSHSPNSMKNQRMEHQSKPKKNTNKYVPMCTFSANVAHALETLKTLMVSSWFRITRSYTFYSHLCICRRCYLLLHISVAFYLCSFVFL